MISLEMEIEMLVDRMDEIKEQLKSRAILIKAEIDRLILELNQIRATLIKKRR